MKAADASVIVEKSPSILGGTWKPPAVQKAG